MTSMVPRGPQPVRSIAAHNQKLEHNDGMIPHLPIRAIHEARVDEMRAGHPSAYGSQQLYHDHSSTSLASIVPLLDGWSPWCNDFASSWFVKMMPAGLTARSDTHVEVSRMVQ